jgi:hypothetical protein
MATRLHLGRVRGVAQNRYYLIWIVRDLENRLGERGESKGVRVEKLGVKLRVQ